jgi:hypothetical protein
LHPNYVHLFTSFVERLATSEEQKAGVPDPTVLNRTPAELWRRYRQERQALLQGRRRGVTLQ